MTPAERKIVLMLLKGHFLREQKRGKKSVFVIYDAKVNPISRVKANIIDSLSKKVPEEIELWKYNRNKDASLNLSMVRRLHGNHIIKRLYKKRELLETNSNIYQRKKSLKINKQSNEKIYSLF